MKLTSCNTSFSLHIPGRDPLPLEGHTSDDFRFNWDLPTVLRRLDPCPMCDAAGALYGCECPTCHGDRFVEEPDAAFAARMKRVFK